MWPEIRIENKKWTKNKRIRAEHIERKRDESGEGGRERKIRVK